MKKTALVIMAAGIGSRFGKGIKQLAPVGPKGEIIMDYSIHDALEAGFNKVVFIIRKDLEDEFKKVIGDRISKITEVAYAFQEIDDLPGDFQKPADRTKPWGTGHAVLAAKKVLSEPFAVINADDYYGKEAYVKVHDYLVQDHPQDGPMHICMAGFRLGNTLSDNGSVTRGVCHIEDGKLVGVTETHNIFKTADGAETRNDDGTAEALDTKSLVSMNMWGLTPEFMEILEKGFIEFLGGIKEGDIKKEYLLPSEVPPLPLWRKLTGGLGILGTVVCLVRILRISDLSELLTEGGLTNLAGDTFKLYLAMLVSLFVVAVSFSRAAPQPVHSSLGGRPLSKRTRLASAVSLLLVPLTIFVGIVYFGKKSYGAVSILVLLECMAPFALIFEGRKPKARELVLIAALCALAVAGRAALFMLPGFKPVAALVILSGVAFGGETGFLVGAMSMLTSNVLFGQGPWTPFQMFAMGLIGFLAGLAFQKGLLRAGRAPLAIFGAVSVVLIYGGLMNPASAILYQPNLSWSVLKAYYLTGFPFDLVHAAATALFLWFGAEPMLEKLERVKRKYGLTEIP